MFTYRDLDGDSGVTAFDVGLSHIDVQFKDGAVYRFTSSSVGQENLVKMIQLARSGEGLNAFINKSVRKRYEARLK